jgi:hypothetical protein
MSDREIDPYFRDAIGGLRDAAQHLIAAHNAIVLVSSAVQEAGSALVRTTEAMLHAKDEHEDLRESVHRLEGLVEEILRRQNGGTP